jgi:hypothetical protein
VAKSSCVTHLWSSQLNLSDSIVDLTLSDLLHYKVLVS